MSARRAALATASAAAAAGTLALGAQPALADREPPVVGPHRHVVMTPNGEEREVVPRVCGGPATRAFLQFHADVHMSAPGLHNRHGAEIQGRPCPTR